MAELKEKLFSEFAPVSTRRAGVYLLGAGAGSSASRARGAAPWTEHSDCLLYTSRCV